MVHVLHRGRWEPGHDNVNDDWNPPYSSPTSPHSETLNNGFAFSTDGVAWKLSKHNPIAVNHDLTPWNAAMAEVHALIDKATRLVYVYHNQRW